MNQIAFIAKQVHNVSQVILWLYVFIAQIPPEGPYFSLHSWKMNQYWDPTISFRTYLIWAQSLQLFDVVFSILGWTRNSVPTVFVQILSRYFILYAVFPFVPEGHYAVFMACICWAWTEVIRFSFYTLKEFNIQISAHSFTRLIGFFRYNSFIFLYPIGVSGELLSSYQAYLHFRSLPEDQRPYTLNLPNKLNVAFHLTFIVQYVIPCLYIGIFPQLYGHMWIQRSKYNKSMATEVARAALKVPDNLKEFKPVKELKKLSGDKVQTGQTLERGKNEVLLIDFWATWCPPCQRPMQHNQNMLEKNEKKWQDKARIIGISIDNNESALKTHIKTKKWDKIVHYQRVHDYSIERFKIQGIPHVMLVNRDGEVVFKGHPALRRNLEQDIDDLIAGKELSLNL